MDSICSGKYEHVVDLWAVLYVYIGFPWTIDWIPLSKIELNLSILELK
jgi:hypothetical protein